MLIIVFNLLLAGCVTYAFVRGGAPERVVAAAFIAAAAATYVTAARPEWYSSFHRPEIGLLLIDSALLAVLVVVALTANRFWPIWLAAFQLFTLLVHVAKSYQTDVLPEVYFAFSARIAYPMLIMLALGTTSHFTRLRRNGSDPDWMPGHGDDRLNGR